MLYVNYMSFEGYDMNVWVWADLLEEILEKNEI